MPNYEYECQDCFHVFNIRATIKEMEKGNFLCEKCNSKNMRRLFNGFGYCGGNSSSTSGSSSCTNCHSRNCSACNN